jgi:hypothetical protein
MIVTIYGCRVAENGSSGAVSSERFHPWSTPSQERSGIKAEINPADVWEIITPDGAAVSADKLHLLWMLNGHQQESTAILVHAMADNNLNGFRHKAA